MLLGRNTLRAPTVGKEISRSPFGTMLTPQITLLFEDYWSKVLRCGSVCRKQSCSAKIDIYPASLAILLEQLMAQVCEVCGKGPRFGNNISHAHNVTKRRWNINLRPVRAKTKTGNRRMRVCTTCLRSGKVAKA